MTLPFPSADGRTSLPFILKQWKKIVIKVSIQNYDRSCTNIACHHGMQLKPNAISCQLHREAVYFCYMSPLSSREFSFAYTQSCLVIWYDFWFWSRCVPFYRYLQNICQWTLFHVAQQKNHKSIAFLCNTGPYPLKIHKATTPIFNVGPSSARQRNAI